MIKKLTESNRESLLEYLYVEGSLNIFIIGDVEAYGFDKNFQTIYGEFDDENNYLAVLLFYRENCIFYSHNRKFNTEWLKIYSKHDFKYLSGAQSIFDNLIEYFKDFKVQPMFFCEANSLEEGLNDTAYEVKKVNTKEDCEKLFDILISINEFDYKNKTKDDFVTSKLLGLKMGSTLYIEENGKIISTVATTAETTKSAMVVAVATLESARKRGLATILMKHLMKEYFEEKNKYLCLFYDNPTAGNIYKKLGFKDVDKWVMLSKE